MTIDLTVWGTNTAAIADEIPQTVTIGTHSGVRCNAGDEEFDPSLEMAGFKPQCTVNMHILASDLPFSEIKHNMAAVFNGKNYRVTNEKLSSDGLSYALTLAAEG